MQRIDEVEVNVLVGYRGGGRELVVVLFFLVLVLFFLLLLVFLDFSQLGILCI